MLLPIVNMSLRGATLVSKFLLVFFIAKKLSPADLGLYGLLQATITYSIYLVGLDFYIFSSRELLKQETNKWGGVLKSQMAITLLLYGLCFLPLLLLFYLNILPWSVSVYFFVLLVLEHGNRELNRLLVIMSHPMLATVVLFIRSGIWGLFVIALSMLGVIDVSLSLIIQAWIAGNMLASVISVIVISVYFPLGGWRLSIDRSWIIKGVRICFPFLLATLALSSIETIGRYWMKALAGVDVLGGYTLYLGIAGAMTSFIDAGVFSFIYPKMVTSYNEDDGKKFRSLLSKLYKQTLLLIISFSIVVALLIETLLQWLDKTLYLDYLSFLYWALLINALYCTGTIAHYALYAQNKDKTIIVAHFVGLCVFLFGVPAWAMLTKDYAVPLAVSSAYFIILSIKTIVFYRKGRWWLLQRGH